MHIFRLDVLSTLGFWHGKPLLSSMLGLGPCLKDVLHSTEDAQLGVFLGFGV